MIPLVPYTHRDTRYMIFHRQSNKLLTSDSITSPGTLNFNDRNGGSSQQWKFTLVGSYYTIQNYATGLNLDGDGTVNAAAGVMIRLKLI